MTATNVAVDVAAALAEEGTVVVTRPELYARVREQTDAEALDHGAIRDALAAEDWEYGRHLYFDAATLPNRVTQVAAGYRSAGRLLLTHREVCDSLADEGDRPGVEGWTKGPFVETVTEAFAEAGWLSDTIDGSDSRVYVYPLLSAIRDEHPRGRFWRSPEELFGYYLQTSVTSAVGDG